MNRQQIVEKCIEELQGKIQSNLVKIYPDKCQYVETSTYEADKIKITARVLQAERVFLVPIEQSAKVQFNLSECITQIDSEIAQGMV